MRVVFMGTPDFAVPSLKEIVNAGFDVLAVITQPDRPGGRGKKIRKTPVKLAAEELGLQVLQPAKVREPDFINELRRLNPEIIIVAAFGQLLPSGILDLPRYGCINVHASLLPAYRGAAPIHRAVINGEQQTGVTIMQMDAGLDTGDMLLQEKIIIGPEDTVGSVHDRLALLGGRLLVKAVELIQTGRAEPVPQDDARSSYAAMLKREDEIICWAEDVEVIKNRVRGLNPWPGARTELGGKVLKIWRVALADGPAVKGKPGQVLEASAGRGILVQAGNAVLSLEELQLQGRKSMRAADFLRGNALTPGIILGGPPCG
ncbi:methionyl-tRNA formyltransferase [Desulfotomaculum arcticum]|uniref:Methionyl-tRNA formyltransferase n=1 Tax=Desulfotruncus arcticus DSM 17038 TaxID=1121424 RepID=A0A1I2RDF0_9FIRM|nr:methionyl-tRNA formyltransferase [Desulfotruncus arcticus]SFG36637.1 methionyl-tRNA formyltransferase [Desulfotomaculum arcticum] [Desulfotruncus arcticus DSM 17038]